MEAFRHQGGPGSEVDSVFPECEFLNLLHMVGQAALNLLLRNLRESRTLTTPS